MPAGALTYYKPEFHFARHVTSRDDSTGSTRRARRDERVKPCCSTRPTQPKCMGLERVVSRRDEPIEIRHTK